ncbi:MAG: hypothetical protein EOM73_16625, partial [Bacteroidia bacterium]|nr:hypothetical protein [Bacteroidia bacterium]
EMAVPVRHELMNTLNQTQIRLKDGLYRFVSEKRTYVDGLYRGLPRLTEMIHQHMQRLDDKDERFQRAFVTLHQRLTDKIEGLGRLLDAHSYERILDKGFAFVTDVDNAPITEAKTARTQEKMDIHFKDGVVSVVSPKQGSLF